MQLKVPRCIGLWYIYTYIYIAASITNISVGINTALPRPSITMQYARSRHPSLPGPYYDIYCPVPIVFITSFPVLGLVLIDRNEASTRPTTVSHIIDGAIQQRAVTNTCLAERSELYLFVPLNRPSRGMRRPCLLFVK